MFARKMRKLLPKHRRVRADVYEKQDEYVIEFLVQKQQVILDMTLADADVLALEFVVAMMGGEYLAVSEGVYYFVQPRLIVVPVLRYSLV